MTADTQGSAGNAAAPRTELFSQAAAICAGEVDATPNEALSLLNALGYGRSAAPEIERANQVALLHAAAKFTRIFQLQAPEAPGLVFLGGQVDPAIIAPAYAGHGALSVGGMGLTLREAFQSCVGEGIEYLSQFEDGTEDLIVCDRSSLLCMSPANVRAFLETLLLAHDKPIEVLRASSLGDDSSCLLPAEICLRRLPSRSAFKAPFKLSMGCAAGRTKSEAILHGLSELIERDAAALWWRGGRRGRPIAAESEAHTKAQALLSELRHGGEGRKTWFVDITTDVGVPVVAALSCRNDGSGFAAGFSARPQLANAAEGAIRELCQSELALAVIAAKLAEGGPAQLSAQDRSHLARAKDIDATGNPLLQPRGVPNHHEGTPAGDPETAVEWITSRLKAIGINAYVIDLSRQQFSTPVVRVVTPGLQIEPSSLVSARLAGARASNGFDISAEPAVDLF
jgi:ribosomal protein S12 methylthiotransferase accessory factor